MRLIIVDNIPNVDSLIRTMKELGVSNGFVAVERVPAFQSPMIPPALIAEVAEVDARDAAKANALLDERKMAGGGKSVYEAFVKSRPKKITSAQLVRDYVRANPGCRPCEIRNATGIRLDYVNVVLHTYTKKGLLRRERVDNKMAKYYSKDNNANVLCNPVSSQHV